MAVKSERLAGRIGRLARASRSRGLGGSLAWAGRKAAARLALEAAAVRQGARARHAPADAAVLAPGPFVTLAEYLEHLATVGSPAFPLPPATTTEYAAAAAALPGGMAAITATAERICRHELALLGRDLRYPGAIPWHRDPDGGPPWPRQYVGMLDGWLWRDDVPADLKLPWELSRHQYLVPLAKAAWLTGDERYADECAGLILSWVEQNPVGFGINWYSALEIGVRLISWCLAFRFLRGSRRFRRRAGAAFLRGVWQQATYLSSHLTTDLPVRNNHVIGEVTGLVVAAAHFPALRGAADWLATGSRVLAAELADQTYPDGMNAEQSPAYHRFVLDFALLALILGRQGAIPPLPGLEPLVEHMLDYAAAVALPSGEIPALGDGDDGRGFLFSGATVPTYADALSLGAALHGRPLPPAGPAGEAALWLLGPQAARPPSQPAVDLGSAAFVAGGQYVIRQGSGRDADYALFRCGPFGWGGEGHCAHAHCDLLSLIVASGGEPLLVDSGTYTYHGLERRTFRLTPAHNTVRIDGLEQARPGNAFSWTAVPQARCLEWTGQRVAGSLTYANGVTFTRALEWQAPGTWLVEDTFRGSGRHDIEWHFHFPPGCGVAVEGSGATVRRPRDTVRCQADERIGLGLAEGWCSPAYGRRERAAVLVGEWQGHLASGVGFRWLFGPLRA